MTIAALDPGRDKCGFAVLERSGRVCMQRVIATAALEQEVQAAQLQYGFTQLIEGNGTTSQSARQRLTEALPDLTILVVDEYRTTELAKGEYWKAYPPRGWRRLLPVTMQVPPVPVDDFVAVILARRYLQQMEEKNHDNR
ncbi:MAG: pre-16S rRNA-processing nuclease YqgF [Selenomonas sp.]|nr:pre-16S rRNA-processing nuclease YqgF [Selenomonas sp.]